MDISKLKFVIYLPISEKINSQSLFSLTLKNDKSEMKYATLKANISQNNLESSQEIK